MRHRRRLHEGDARRLLAVYARANGIDGRSLYARQINLSQRASTPTTAGVVEIVRAGGPAQPP